jgi:hypothetical protein
MIRVLIRGEEGTAYYIYILNFTVLEVKLFSFTNIFLGERLGNHLNAPSLTIP